MATIKAKKKFFNDAIEKLISGVPDGLTDLEKVRYIYVEMGNLFSYDEKYWFGTMPIQSTIYSKAEKEPIDFSELKEKQRVSAICVNITKAYNYALAKVGIYAFEHIDFDHYYTDVLIGDKIYSVDLNNDLKYIQLHLPTRNFASSGENVISQEEIEDVDKKIGYSYRGEEQIKNVINEAKSKNENEKMLYKKVENIFNASNQIEGINNLGTVERDKTYEYLFNKCLSKKEIDNEIFVNHTYEIKVNNKTNKKERTNYNIMLRVQDFDKETMQNFYTFFIYDKTEKRCRKIDIDEIPEYLEDKHLLGKNKIKISKSISKAENRSKRDLK